MNFRNRTEGILFCIQYSVVGFNVVGGLLDGRDKKQARDHNHGCQTDPAEQDLTEEVGVTLHLLNHLIYGLKIVIHEDLQNKKKNYVPQL